MKAEYRLTLDDPGRACGDHSGVIDKAAATVWREAAELLSNVTLLLNGELVQLKIEWTGVRDYFTRYHELFVFDPPERDGTDYVAAFDKRAAALDNFAPIDVSVAVYSTTSVPTSLVVQCLQDIFLIVNLASPGALNLYTARLAKAGQSDGEKLDLDCRVFESAWVSTLRSGRPEVGPLDLGVVLDWFGRLNMGKRQLADSGPVKALFCLLHLARGYEPTTLLWITHGLEALYSVPNALSFNFLRERMALLFEVSPDETQSFAKKLREMYKLRNSFVHGGMSIARPEATDLLDARTGKEFARLIDVLDFGGGLLIASLQRMIQLGLTELIFRETLCNGDR